MLRGMQRNVSRNVRVHGTHVAALIIYLFLDKTIPLLRRRAVLCLLPGAYRTTKVSSNWAPRFLDWIVVWSILSLLPVKGVSFDSAAITATGHGNTGHVPVKYARYLL